MAFTATGRLGEAEQELTELTKLVDDLSNKGLVTFSSNTGQAILRIAAEVVAGEIAAKRKDWDRAILHLDRAIRFEDALIYQEPPDWHSPVRQNLGSVLFEAGRPDEAEGRVLGGSPEESRHRWSLFGLLQALKAQGKQDAAALIEQRLKDAWKHALTASRIGS